MTTPLEAGYKRARSKATTRLVAAHKDEYDLLYWSARGSDGKRAGPAQREARKELRARYPDEFRKLYEEEKARARDGV